MFEINNLKSVCLNCQDRAVKMIDGKLVSCHSYCEKYLEFKAENDRLREERSKQKADERDYRDYLIDTKVALIKRYRVHYTRSKKRRK